MIATTMREQLHDYIDEVDDKKLGFLLAIFEDVSLGSSDLWSDPAFLNEIKSRIKELESGANKGRDWNEILKEIKLAYQR